MKKLLYKIYSMINILVKDLEKKNREDLIFDLLIAGEKDSENITIFNNCKSKFENHLSNNKNYFENEIIEIKKFQNEYSDTEQELIENSGYNLEFIKKVV